MRFLRYMAALSIVASAITATATLATATVATAAGAASNGHCPILTAGPWQLPYAPYTKGNKYDVSVSGYSCAKADTYVKKLVTHRVSHGIPTRVKGGPPGWQCTASRSKTGLAYSGQCSKKNTFSGPFFAWTVG